MIMILEKLYGEEIRVPLPSGRYTNLKLLKSIDLREKAWSVHNRLVYK